jgi:hypothetical protein
MTDVISTAEEQQDGDSTKSAPPALSLSKYALSNGNKLHGYIQAKSGFVFNGGDFMMPQTSNDNSEVDQQHHHGKSEAMHDGIASSGLPLQVFSYQSTEHNGHAPAGIASMNPPTNEARSRSSDAVRGGAGASMRDLIREQSINKLIKLSGQKPIIGPTPAVKEVRDTPSILKKVTSHPSSSQNKDNRKILGKTLHAAGVALLITGSPSLPSIPPAAANAATGGEQESKMSAIASISADEVLMGSNEQQAAAAAESS